MASPAWFGPTRALAGLSLAAVGIAAGFAAFSIGRVPAAVGSPPRPGDEAREAARRETLKLIAEAAPGINQSRGAGGPPQRALAGSDFVNFESPHVHPLDLTPDGSRLLAVNTADNRLEVLDLTGATPVRALSISVGLEPVSVRARTNSEAWVCNLLSDSVSIVDLGTGTVTATIAVGDEPCDVVFAGTRAFVSLSQLNQVKVYVAADPAAAPTTLSITGEDPRALATDGTRVFAAIFESGNRTTVVPETVVSSNVNPYQGDPNPPPNSGNGFDPPLAPENPAAPDTSLIVKRATDGSWRDDNNGNWSSAVTWNLHDRDVAIINASTLGVTYATGLMNLNMALAVRPGGTVTVVGTDATNHIRFEPNVSGTFVRVIMASFPAAGGTPTLVDLNPHLTYAEATVPQATRDLSIGDPRGIAWDASGSTGFVTGMGSNALLVINAAGAPQARIPVAQGPTGVVLDEPRGRAYVLGRFESAVSVVDIASRTESARVPLHDPTPQEVRAGRPFLYATHLTSGLGQAACASCHIDGRMDQLAWDLGNPAGEVKDFNQVCNFGLSTDCEDWHPMKGPLTTQTLFGIVGTEPFHWRGDREGLIGFAPAFKDLLGDDSPLPTNDIAAFETFLATLTPPPNPNRNLDNSLKTSLPGSGNPTNGLTLFNGAPIDGAIVNCNACHTLPTGTNGMVISGNVLQEAQSMKIPQLRNMYEKTGFLRTSTTSNKGFGFLHDGSLGTLTEFLSLSVFDFPSGTAGTQQRKDIEALLLSLPEYPHAAVGQQVTLDGTDGAASISLVTQFESLAAAGAIDLVVKGRAAGISRGWLYLPDPGAAYQSDRVAESISASALRASAAPGAELTYTVAPVGTGWRIALDRDRDGHLDRDELDAGSDPADPGSVPGSCTGDLDGDGDVDGADLAAILADWGCAGASCAGDLNDDAVVDGNDLAQLLAHWGCAP